MSSIKNHILQTGVWDAPQIISFDSLFDRYSVQNTFDQPALAKMLPVLENWKKCAKGNLNASTLDLSQFAIQANIVPASSRNKLVMYKETPQILYKVCASLINGINPLSNALRPPMSQLIQETIDREQLSGLGVPQEGIFPIASKEEILKAKSERKMNQMFIVCSVKKEVFGCEDTIVKIKEKQQAAQLKLADQACKIPFYTGLGDFRWHNLQMDTSEDKLWVLDTEPLFGELLIHPIEEPFKDPFFLENTGRTLSTSAEFALRMTLSRSAKKGLTYFNQSSEKHELGNFADVAQSYLEKCN